MALNTRENEGGIHGANPRSQNRVLPWNFTKLLVSVCSTETLAMLCLAYADATLAVPRFRKEDTHRGFLITKPKLGVNGNDPLNFTRVNSLLCGDLALLGQAHVRCGYSEVLVYGFFNVGHQNSYLH